MHLNSSANPYGRPRKSRVSTAGNGRSYDAGEIAAFMAMNPQIFETSRRREVGPVPDQSELVMIQPGTFATEKVEPEPAGLKEPKSATMEGSLCVIPLHRVDASTLARRKADEAAVMKALTSPHSWAVGDVSHQRYLHAKAGGSYIADEAIEIEQEKAPGVIRSTKAKPRTVGKRKRVVARLEVLHRQGKINDDHFVAARLFQSASFRGCNTPGLCAQYGGAEIKGNDDLLPTERMVDKAALKREAYEAVARPLHFILDWIATEAYADVSLKVIGDRYKPHLKDEQTKRRHAVRLIVSVLTALLKVFRLK